MVRIGKLLKLVPKRWLLLEPKLQAELPTIIVIIAAGAMEDLGSPHTHKKTGKLKRKDKMSLFYYLTVFSILLNPTTRTMRNCDSSPNYNRLINCDSSPNYNRLINSDSSPNYYNQFINCDSFPNYNRLINCDSSPIYYNQLINDASNRLLRLFDQIQSHGQRLYRLLLSLPSTTHIRAKKRLQFVVRLKNKGSYLNFEITGREKKRCTRYITFCPSNNHHHFEQYSRFNYMLSTVR